MLLHGVQSSRLSWWRVEQDLIDLGCTVRSLDLLGHGERARGVAGSLTIADLADDVLRRIEPSTDVVVGHSLGAIVALVAARLDPTCFRAILIEDPPGLRGALDPVQVAAEVESSVRSARAAPTATAAALLDENPRWSPVDAQNAVRSRQQLDLEHVTDLLRRDRWDLSELVATCPVPLFLLAATRNSALTEPDRSAVLSLLPANRHSIVESGHSIHRDRPGLWVHRVVDFLRETTSGSTDGPSGRP